MYPIYTFFGGTVVGYLSAFVKYLFDAKKSRFDLKAKVLQDLWREVLLAHSIAANIDPEGVPPQDEPPSAQKIRREYARFLEQEAKAAQIVRGNQPFYPAAIHDLAKELLSEAMQLANYVADPKSHETRGYWNQSKETTKNLNSLRDRLAEAIRVEMNRLSLNPFTK